MTQKLKTLQMTEPAPLAIYYHLSALVCVAAQGLMIRR